MKLLKIDEKLDKKLQQVYKNLPYINKESKNYDSYCNVDKFSHTKVFLGGVDSKGIVKQAFPIKIIGKRNVQGPYRGTSSCVWAPALYPESLQEAIFKVYKKKLIPKVIIRINIFFCSFKIRLFFKFFNPPTFFNIYLRLFYISVSCGWGRRFNSY